jgi:hypothetical protein
VSPFSILGAIGVVTSDGRVSADGLKAVQAAADEVTMFSSFSTIKFAVVLAALGAGYVGYQHVGGSTASGHDRAVAYLESQTTSGWGSRAKPPQAIVYRDGSVSCDDTPTHASGAARALFGDIDAFDCTAVTTDGRVDVKCLIVGGKLHGDGVGLLPNGPHCADALPSAVKMASDRGYGSP